MKRRDYSALLKLLSASAVGLSIYAAVVTTRYAAFGNDGGFLSAAFFALTMMFGYLAGIALLKTVPKFALRAASKKPVKFIAFIFGIKNLASSLSAAAAWLLVLLPLSSAVILYGGSMYGNNIYRILYEGVTAALAYAVGLKHSKQSFAGIMSVRKSYAVFAVLALCLEALNLLSGAGRLRPWIFGISYYVILTYLIVRNQDDIDSNIFDKKHIEKSILPGNLRRLNTYCVIILFLAVVLLFNLKSVVALLIKLALKVSIYVAAAVLWLIGHIFAGGSTQQQADEPNSFGLFDGGPETAHPLLDLIFDILKYAVMLYLIYRLLLALWRRVPAIAAKLFALLKKLFSVKEGNAAPEMLDYSDETETVRPTRERRKLKALVRNAKQRRKATKGISDPVEKVRHMYRTILLMLPPIGVRTERSDTTSEILKKSEAIDKVAKSLAPFTDIYNPVRYGGKIPDESTLASAEEYFGKTVEAINRHIKLRAK